MKSMYLVACATLLLSISMTAQNRPDFSGTWVVDRVGSASAGGGGSMAGGAALRPGGSVSGGGMGGGAAGSVPELQITQSTTSLAIERTGPVPHKLIYTFDGEENVNVNGRITTRTRSRWEGAKLVTEGTQVLSTDGNQATATFKEVRSLAADGTLVVESERTMEGREMNASKQVFRRK